MELKQTIAKNIAELRRESGMTQLQLAEKLNYSDKAVSKWESGGSVPDVSVLMEIAKLFGVTVDYLLSEDHKIPVKAMVRETVRGRKHLIISLMSVVLAWLIATFAFVVLNIFNIGTMPWLSFIWCVPVSAVILLVFNSIWGKPVLNYVIISVLVWSFLASVYLTLLPLNLWLIFVIGVPGQIIVCLWAVMRAKRI